MTDGVVLWAAVGRDRLSKMLEGDDELSGNTADDA